MGQHPARDRVRAQPHLPARRHRGPCCRGSGATTRTPRPRDRGGWRHRFGDTPLVRGQRGVALRIARARSRGPDATIPGAQSRHRHRSPPGGQPLPRPPTASIWLVRDHHHRGRLGRAQLRDAVADIGLLRSRPAGGRPAAVDRRFPTRLSGSGNGERGDGQARCAGSLPRDRPVPDLGRDSVSGLGRAWRSDRYQGPRARCLRLATGRQGLAHTLVPGVESGGQLHPAPGRGARGPDDHDGRACRSARPAVGNGGERDGRDRPHLIPVHWSRPYGVEPR